MIHPTAVVDRSAEIASDVNIGPYSVVGPRVQIGAGTTLHSHVVIHSNTRLGEGNEIFPHTILGSPPQDTKYKGGACYLIIGSHNILREHVSIHLPSVPEETTSIGDHNFLMGNTHIAHNCRIGNHITLTQGAALSGHVQIEDHAILGGQTGVHQFVRIGRSSMVGGQAGVTKDIPPYTKVIGTPAFYLGINRKGLERENIPEKTIGNLAMALEILFRKSSSTEDAILKIQAQCRDGNEIAHLIKFLGDATRGICT
jgi:UDP-N-acetylglucosamine acyltransferase